jgi:hypothetical protein
MRMGGRNLLQCLGYAAGKLTATKKSVPWLPGHILSPVEDTLDDYVWQIVRLI